VEAGYFESREKARRAVMAGLVFVNGEREDKPGAAVDPQAQVVVRGAPMAYVSRGGLKLEKAIREFGITLTGKTCIDIGASTGGFTDCMLQNGAQKVFAVDVGYGQLAWKLRSDSRVVVMERTNFRYVKPEDIGEAVDFASVDVSFISLKKMLPPAKKLLKPDAEMVCLIKPQFEAGREKVGKKGVVRDPSVHMTVIREVQQFAEGEGFYVYALSYSPIKGPEGNIEYLLYLGLKPSDKTPAQPEQVVTAAHENLGNINDFIGK
jgi:23S rRNA (cytidine1920-2'-O)/16S rRNA (cytidine1409-2'-O)-methyltransferase